MSKLTEHVSYLKGLADGLKLNDEKDSNRLLLGILDALEETVQEIEELEQRHEMLEDVVADLDDSVDGLFDDIFGDEEDDDEEEDGPIPLFPHSSGWEDDEEEFIGDEGDEDEDEDGDDEDDGDGSEDEIISYECPHCGHELTFHVDSVDFDEDYRCPVCGKPVFPEFPEQDDEPEDPDED